MQKKESNLTFRSVMPGVSYSFVPRDPVRGSRLSPDDFSSVISYIKPGKSTIEGKTGTDIYFSQARAIFAQRWWGSTAFESYVKIDPEVPYIIGNFAALNIVNSDDADILALMHPSLPDSQLPSGPGFNVATRGDYSRHSTMISRFSYSQDEQDVTSFISAGDNEYFWELLCDALVITVICSNKDYSEWWLAQFDLDPYSGTPARRPGNIPLNGVPAAPPQDIITTARYSFFDGGELKDYLIVVIPNGTQSAVMLPVQDPGLNPAGPSFSFFARPADYINAGTVRAVYEGPGDNITFLTYSPGPRLFSFATTGAHAGDLETTANFQKVDTGTLGRGLTMPQPVCLPFISPERPDVVALFDRGTNTPLIYSTAFIMSSQETTYSFRTRPDRTVVTFWTWKIPGYPYNNAVSIFPSNNQLCEYPPLVDDPDPMFVTQYTRGYAGADKILFNGGMTKSPVSTSEAVLTWGLDVAAWLPEITSFADLPPGSPGEDYKAVITANNNPTDFLFGDNVQHGINPGEQVYPDGLALTTEGNLQGTVSSDVDHGDYKFKVYAVNEAGKGKAVEMTIHIGPGDNAPVIEWDDEPESLYAEKGKPFGPVTFTATNNPDSFGYDGVLPGGFNFFNGTEGGRAVGILKSALVPDDLEEKDYTVTLWARNGTYGKGPTKDIVIRVEAAAFVPPKLDPIDPPDSMTIAVQNEEYRQKFSYSTNTAELQFSSDTQTGATRPSSSINDYRVPAGLVLRKDESGQWMLAGNIERDEVSENGVAGGIYYFGMKPLDSNAGAGDVVEFALEVHCAPVWDSSIKNILTIQSNQDIKINISDYVNSFPPLDAVDGVDFYEANASTIGGDDRYPRGLSFTFENGNYYLEGKTTSRAGNVFTCQLRASNAIGESRIIVNLEMVS